MDVYDTRSWSPVPLRYEQFGGDGAIPRDAVPISALTHDDVIGFDPLWDAMELCKSGVLWKGSVASFWLNGAENIARMSRELHDGTYRHGRTTTFMVTCPKRRTIVAQTFRDRVYHRSIVENLLAPTVFPKLIYDNAACQKRKGTDFARARLARMLGEEYRRSGLDGYVLMMDVRKYYDSMLHTVVEDMFDRMLPDWGSAMVIDALRAHYPGERGYNPGSSIVQVAGISLLNKIDHHIKERLRIRGYSRYMDDFRVIHSDIGVLERCRDEVGEMLREMGMSLHEDKTRIVPMSDVIPFLGFDYRVTDTGRVTMLLNPDNPKQMRRKMRRLSRLEERGERPEGTTDTSFECWVAHAKKGDSASLVRNNAEWYEKMKAGEL